MPDVEHSEVRSVSPTEISTKKGTSMGKNNSLARNALPLAAVTIATAFGAVGLAAPAAAAVDRYVEVQNCTQPAGDQKCSPAASFTFEQPVRPATRIDFTASGGHCSDIIANISIDGIWVGGIVVGPGERDGGIIVPLIPGRHNVSVQGQGIPGGCNTEGLRSWAGTVHLQPI